MIFENESCILIATGKTLTLYCHYFVNTDYKRQERVHQNLSGLN